MNKIVLLLIALAAIVAVTSVTYAAPVEKTSQQEIDIAGSKKTGKLLTRVSETDITVADNIVLTLEVVEPQGTTVELPQFKQLGFATDFTERSQRFRVTNISETTRETLADGSSRIHRQYTLEPWLSGDYAILPIMVSFYKTKQKKSQFTLPIFSLMTDGIRINVAPMPDDRKKLSDLMGQADLNQPDLIPKERRTENKTDEELFREEQEREEAELALQERKFPWWIIWSLLILTLLVPLGWLLTRKRIKQFIAKKIIPAHIEAFEGLDKLKQKDLIGQGRIKEFYFELSYILRHYIGGRYQIYADKQTTEEFFQHLMQSNPFDKMTEQILRDFSESTDTVKYSLYRPAAEVANESFQIAWSFVDHTKPKEEKK